MANKDYYELLGVAKGATEQEIKAAYKKKVMQFHPDRFATKPEAERKQAEEKFKEINHAYDVLSDPGKKSNYDQFGTEDGMQGGFGAGGASFNTGAGGFGDIFGDIFGNMFGNGGGKSRVNTPTDGDDITVRLDLSFEEAVYGCDKQIKINRVEKCSSCKGTGANDPKSVSTCSRCKGTGFVTMTQQTIFGVQQVRAQCSDCGGTGKIIKDKCKRCKGQGTTREERIIPVTIPEGVKSGQTITIYNEGNTGSNGGRNGTLFVNISVRAHALFKRDGADLYIEVPISFGVAAKGGYITVPTIKNPSTYAIPAGTQSGDKFRLKGYGVKYLKSNQYGDLYVSVVVETPSKLSKKQIELLDKFQDSLTDKECPKAKKFSDTYLKKPK